MRKRLQLTAIFFISLLIFSILFQVHLLPESKADSFNPQTYGVSNVDSLSYPPITFFEDSNFYRLNFSSFVVEFYKGGFGYNKIFDRLGNVVVYDDRTFMEIYSGNQWKPIGVPQSVSYLKISDFEYNVTRFYTDFLGTSYNVTYNLVAGEKIKTTLSLVCGQSGIFRVNWSPSGIVKSSYKESDLRVMFGIPEPTLGDYIVFDWKDVYDQFGYITETSYSSVAQGLKAVITFTIGSRTVGELIVLDPSTVSSVTSLTALPSRYVLKVGGYWFVFYRNETSGFLVYKSSSDGSTWSSVSSVSETAIAGNDYEVDTDGTNILAVYPNGTYATSPSTSTQVWIRKGTQSEGVISWSTPVQVMTCGGYTRFSLEKSTVNWFVAIESYNNGVSATYAVIVYNSSGLTSWSHTLNSTTMTNTGYIVVPSLSKWENGSATDGFVLITPLYTSSTYRYLIWNGTKNLGENNFASKTGNDYASGHYSSLWYNSEVHFAYMPRDEGGVLKYCYLSTTGWSGETTVNSSTCFYGSLSSQANYLFCFFTLNVDSGSDILYYTMDWSSHTWGATASTLVTGETSVSTICSEQYVSSGDIGIGWRASSSPYLVRFTSLAFVVPEMDYVDNNSSDVDGSANLGSFTNFTAQKYYDNINDTLTEVNVPVTSGNSENFVDNFSSDVDSHANHGTQSNSTAEQDALIAFNDTLTEANVGGGSSNTTVLNDGFETAGAGWAANFDGNGVTTWEQATSSTYGSPWAPHSGTYMAAADSSGDGNLTTDDLDMSTATAIYLSFWYMDDDVDTADNWYLNYFDGSSYVFIADLNNVGSEDTWYQYNVKITDSKYFKSNFRVCFMAGSPDSGEVCFVDDVLVIREVAVANYELDIEFQWTTADYSQATEYLCIRTDTLNAEGLAVDVRDGASWTNIIASLSASSWNNVSISSYLTGATVTFRYHGTSESGDTSQSSWIIECALIHVYTVSDNYRLDVEEQFTNANSSRTTELLCINTGAFSFVSDLMVYAWNGTWNWVMNCSANQWNNVSVALYLTSSTFTFKFVDGTQTGDLVQSSWNIESTLLWTYSLEGDIYNISLTITCKETLTIYHVTSYTRTLNLQDKNNLTHIPKTTYNRELQLSDKNTLTILPFLNMFALMSLTVKAVPSLFTQTIYNVVSNMNLHSSLTLIINSILNTVFSLTNKIGLTFNIGMLFEALLSLGVHSSLTLGLQSVLNVVSNLNLHSQLVFIPQTIFNAVLSLAGHFNLTFNIGMLFEALLSLGVHSSLTLGLQSVLNVLLNLSNIFNLNLILGNVVITLILSLSSQIGITLVPQTVFNIASSLASSFSFSLTVLIPEIAHVFTVILEFFVRSSLVWPIVMSIEEVFILAGAFFGSVCLIFSVKFTRRKRKDRTFDNE